MTRRPSEGRGLTRDERLEYRAKPIKGDHAIVITTFYGKRCGKGNGKGVFKMDEVLMIERSSMKRHHAVRQLRDVGGT
jgi:hypothetical protein